MPVYTPLQPQFEALFAAEIGDAGGPNDGFDSIIDNAAMSFPGTDLVERTLDPLIAAQDQSAALVSADPDPSLDGDLSAWGVAGETIVNEL